MRMRRLTESVRSQVGEQYDLYGQINQRQRKPLFNEDTDNSKAMVTTSTSALRRRLKFRGVFVAFSTQQAGGSTSG